ncbi:hypothetical protein GPECTOR_13g864 [Gonium pectorale]|uniref:EF-hand domain-containing protein n=1 Tax=Gonium pectorale TaxID=33097 RepID=A0A150GNM4_GONPE|nr:hypothetical protein GPECTOR_13g864 [Gonium pectorale]|eukprot:KXZ51375.1 hypothetical protein GPECTOR_13g864 [Gonium pectorale]
MGAGCSSDKAAATSEAPAPEPKGQADLPASKYVAPATPPAAPSPVPAPASAPADDEFDDEDDGSAEGKRDPAARMDALTRCFEALDKDKSGTIDFRELKQYLFKTLKQVFKALDRDGSGFVELPELKLMLGRSGWELDTMSDEVQAIMDKLDKNGDAKISEQEFFVTLSAVRKSVNSDPAFLELLENVLTVAQTGGPVAGGKPVLTEVLFAEDA